MWERLFFALAAAVFEARKARQLQNKLSSTLYTTANVGTVSAGLQRVGEWQPWCFDNYSRGRDVNFLANKQLKKLGIEGVGRGKWRYDLERMKRIYYFICRMLFLVRKRAVSFFRKGVCLNGLIYVYVETLFVDQKKGGSQTGEQTCVHRGGEGERLGWTGRLGLTSHTATCAIDSQWEAAG